MPPKLLRRALIAAHKLRIDGAEVDALESIVGWRVAADGAAASAGDIVRAMQQLARRKLRVAGGLDTAGKKEKAVGKRLDELEGQFVQLVGRATPNECLSFLRVADVSSDAARHRFAEVTRQVLAYR